jgi:hypothetical protein
MAAAAGVSKSTVQQVWSGANDAARSHAAGPPELVGSGLDSGVVAGGLGGERLSPVPPAGEPLVAKIAGSQPESHTID